MLGAAPQVSPSSRCPPAPYVTLALVGLLTEALGPRAERFAGRVDASIVPV